MFDSQRYHFCFTMRKDIKNIVLLMMYDIKWGILSFIDIYYPSVAGHI